MNQNVEVFEAILRAAFAPIPRWHIALGLSLVAAVLGLATYGLLALVGLA